MQRLAALLHDAPEYVIGDMISPFKSVVGGGYKEVEERLQRAIHLRFALPAELPATLREAIKRADQIAAYFEATVLAGFSIAEASRYFGRPRGFDASRFDLASRAPNRVQKSFLSRFRRDRQGAVRRAPRAYRPGRSSRSRNHCVSRTQTSSFSPESSQPWSRLGLSLTSMTKTPSLVSLRSTP